MFFIQSEKFNRVNVLGRAGGGEFLGSNYNNYIAFLLFSGASDIQN